MYIERLKQTEIQTAATTKAVESESGGSVDRNSPVWRGGAVNTSRTCSSTEANEVKVI